MLGVLDRLRPGRPEDVSTTLAPPGPATTINTTRQPHPQHAQRTVELAQRPVQSHQAPTIHLDLHPDRQGQVLRHPDENPRPRRLGTHTTSQAPTQRLQIRINLQRRPDGLSTRQGTRSHARRSSHSTTRQNSPDGGNFLGTQARRRHFASRMHNPIPPSRRPPRQPGPWARRSHRPR